MNSNQGNSTWKVSSFSSYQTKSVTSSVFLSTPSPEPETSVMITLTKKPHAYHGYMNGYKQPVAKITCKITAFIPTKVEILQRALNYYFNKNNSNLISEHKLAECLGECIYVLQKTAGLPIFDAMQINTSSENIFTLYIPFLNEESFNYAAAFMLDFFNHHLACKTWAQSQQISEQIKQLMSILSSHAPLGSNSLRLLQAAHDADIPWMYIEQNTFQYGYGRNSRWLDSTSTEKTSKISSNLTKNKRSSSLLLKKIGFPVPDQRVVHSEEDAIKYANEMSYPVVIKPNNLDGGVGVTAKLISDTQVKKAYQHALKYSDSLLIEKHVTGKDYRLLVFNGELVWAIERIPASVTGDGLRSIMELIERENQKPERNSRGKSALKKIEITDEMVEYLADQGYSVKTILEAGRHVTLSRVANISNGGMPVAVFEQVHADNKRLAEAAAKLLRLDIAGIDLIIPDIQQSYLTTGGVIIEVNSQPQFGILTAPHLYGQFLTTVIPEKGRIPIIIICGHTSENPLRNSLSEKFKNIGFVENGYAYINNLLVNHASSSFNAAQSLIVNNEMDLLIYCINSYEDIEYQGLPFSYCDYVICDENTANAAFNEGIKSLLKSCLKCPIIAGNKWDDLVRQVELPLSNS